MPATPAPNLHREFTMPHSPSFLANIVPNNTTVFDHPTSKVLIGAAGTLAVTTLGGQTLTITGLAVGVWHDMAVTKILVTGTTATSILAGW